MTFTPHTIDPTLDIAIERDVDVAPELVWRAWTEPELLIQWFTPKPWQTTAVRIDLRPGGEFHTEMAGPDGEPGGGGTGCILEVVPGERLVWTGALAPGYRPQPGELLFSAIIEIAPNGSGGTKYRAIAMHSDPEGRTAHADMGFVEGWNAAFDQLVELMSEG